MSRYSQMNRVAKCGAVDSKYFNNLEQFDIDVSTKIENTINFKSAIRELIIKDPNLIEQRYHNVIEVLKELKEAFEI